MNITLVKQTAQEFEAAATRLIEAGNVDTRLLLHLLTDLLNQAKGEKILKPLTWQEVPGEWYFSEGNLANFPELESAYSKFKIELTGGETPILKALREEKI
jgi:hypothetical protein